MGEPWSRTDDVCANVELAFQAKGSSNSPTRWCCGPWRSSAILKLHDVHEGQMLSRRRVAIMSAGGSHVSKPSKIAYLSLSHHHRRHHESGASPTSADELVGCAQPPSLIKLADSISVSGTRLIGSTCGRLTSRPSWVKVALYRRRLRCRCSLHRLSGSH